MTVRFRALIEIDRVDGPPLGEEAGNPARPVVNLRGEER